MRIAIDVTHMFGREKYGVGYYTWYLVQGLLALRPAHRFFLYHTGHGGLDDPMNLDHAMVKITRTPKLLLKWRAKLDHLDLYHGFPDRYTASGRHGYVLTVCDLMKERYPEWTKYPERCHRASRQTAGLLRQATRVIVFSREVGRELQEVYGLPEGQGAVVPLGVDLKAFGPPQGQDADEEVRTRYGIPPRPYLLFVGSIHPRKNLLTLLRAYALLRARPRLVIAGSPDWQHEEVLASAERIGVGQTVQFTGYVPRRDVIALYRGALAFVFPSWYEGFGLPALEAMACGTPVIASTGGALPEVIGDAGLLVEPGDLEGWREALERIIEDGHLRETLRAQGLARARMFSWEETARKTLAVYEALGG